MSIDLQRVKPMRVKKVSIYIRLCGEPGRPFERLKVRNPRQCGDRDHYCLRVAGKWEFFPEDDPAREDLNETLHHKGEREHELRIGVVARSSRSGRQRSRAKPRSPTPCRSISTTSRQWARTK